MKMKKAVTYDRNIEPEPVAHHLIGTESTIAFVRSTFDLNREEKTWALLLDNDYKLIARRPILSENSKSTPTNPNSALKTALLHGAPFIVLVTIRPESDPNPVLEDDLFTLRLHRIGRSIDTPLLDHLIFGSDDEYFSYAMSERKILEDD